MNNTDPREIIAQSPMSSIQVVVVIICIGLNALDGFDVLAISFASPGIASAWGIDRAALGLVLSMELIGMAVGSAVLGNVADQFGRRPTILGSLVLMAAGMYLAARAPNVVTLSIIRLLTGLGIGGILASVNALVAEYANARRRYLAVSLMAAGYPVGAIVGGSIASWLLVDFDWRSVFYFGALVTLVFIPLTWWFLPESVAHLAEKRPRDALQRINAILTRIGHEPIDSLPTIMQQPRTGVVELLSPALARTTLLLTLAYFALIMTFYFVIKWIPKIVVDLGYAASTAGGVLVWANVGGATGALVLGLLTLKFGARGLVIGALLLGAVMVTVFGFVSTDLQQLTLAVAIAGFFVNASIVGFYAILAQLFPTHVRASGTGLVIGVGRGGAALGPIVAGFLFEAGYSLSTVASCMAAGCVLAAIALSALPKHRTASV